MYPARNPIYEKSINCLSMLILKVRRVMISFLSLPVYRIGYQVTVFIECHVNDLREFRMVLYYN